VPLPSDHRRSQSQRQRQMPQHGSHLSRQCLVVQAGPRDQERLRLSGAEHVQRETDPQVHDRLPGTGNQHLGPTVGWNKRP
jgi:hypothetical protein